MLINKTQANSCNSITFTHQTNDPSLDTHTPFFTICYFTNLLYSKQKKPSPVLATTSTKHHQHQQQQKCVSYYHGLSKFLRLKTGLRPLHPPTHTQPTSQTTKFTIRYIKITQVPKTKKTCTNPRTTLFCEMRSFISSQ